MTREREPGRRLLWRTPHPPRRRRRRRRERRRKTTPPAGICSLDKFLFLKLRVVCLGHVADIPGADWCFGNVGRVGR